MLLVSIDIMVIIEMYFFFISAEDYEERNGFEEDLINDRSLSVLQKRKL